jgi:MerR family transcriptional regulator/heat shock protein HspR
MDPHEVDEDAPVFPIAVAAELAGMHPQTLRQYDRLGLVVPARTAGRVRRYSLADVAKLREIGALSEAGVGLEGISHVVRRVRDLEGELEEQRKRSRERVFAAGYGEVIAVARGQRVRNRNEIVLWRPRGEEPEPGEDERG